MNKPDRLVFISGQVAVNTDGQLVGKDDVAAQCVQVFENIAQLVHAGGGTMADVVQFRTYLTDRAHLPDFLAARTAVFRDLFRTGYYPTNTLLIVAGLVNADYLLEVEATAAI